MCYKILFLAYTGNTMNLENNDLLYIYTSEKHFVTVAFYKNKYSNYSQYWLLL